MITGLYIAKRHLAVTSRKLTDGMVWKCLVLTMIWVISIVFWHLWTFINNDYINSLVSMIPLWVLAWFLLWELISLAENYIIIAGNSSQESIMVIWIKDIIWLWLNLWMKLCKSKAKKLMKDLATKHWYDITKKDNE